VRRVAGDRCTLCCQLSLQAFCRWISWSDYFFPYLMYLRDGCTKVLSIYRGHVSRRTDFRRMWRLLWTNLQVDWKCTGNLRNELQSRMCVWRGTLPHWTCYLCRSTRLWMLLWRSNVWTRCHGFHGYHDLVSSIISYQSAGILAVVK